ncbi:MAG: molybdopterin oxidoreductase [Tenericutes bacterium HGW-Tenericutes-2]|jgi:CxxC motif-containing protein|nr:MAG: molybdopterin oxidoreductase [Tenericutes bacterium HGW-Tenericutes-2]
MKRITCIICPVGCHLAIDDDMNVSGNKCEKGKNYAQIEMTDPKRMLTTTVKTTSSIYPRLSVKTNHPISKKLIFKALNEINEIIISKDVKIGDVIIDNILDTKIDIVATKSIHI